MLNEEFARSISRSRLIPSRFAATLYTCTCARARVLSLSLSNVGAATRLNNGLPIPPLPPPMKRRFPRYFFDAPGGGVLILMFITAARIRLVFLQLAFEPCAPPPLVYLVTRTSIRRGVVINVYNRPSIVRRGSLLGSR